MKDVAADTWIYCKWEEGRLECLEGNTNPM